MKRIFLATSMVVFLCLKIHAQINAPQIPFSGNFGCVGFPCVNAGPLIFTVDGNHTMTPQETSASIIKLVSSVPLTAPRILVAPLTFGFGFTFYNDTTGSQPISVCGVSGGCAVLPNDGQPHWVGSDGANYYLGATSGAVSSINGTTGAVTFAGALTQSGNTFTFTGGSGIAAASSSNQSVLQTAGSSFTFSAVNTASASPVQGLAVNSNNQGPGKYNNSGPWGSTNGLNISHFANTLGIDHGISGNMTNMTKGDYAWMYFYELGFGGCAYGSDECGQGIKGQIFPVGYSQGFISSGASGYISTSPTGAGTGGNVYYEAGTDGGAVVPFTGYVGTLSVNFQAAPVAGGGTFTFGINNGGGSFTTQIVVPVTGVTATAGTQVFTSGTNFTPFIATAGQVMGFYVASGSSVSWQISAGSIGYSRSGTPATGTATYTDVGRLPSLALTMVPVTTGSTNLPISSFACYSPNFGCAGQSSYGWPANGVLLDMQMASYTATVASTSTFLGNQLTYALTSATLPVSTAFGTIASCTGGISTVTNTWTTTSTTCTVTLSTSPTSGYFAGSGTVCLASSPGYVEQAAVTAAGSTGGSTQTVTFLAGHPWGSGAVIGQGGMCGQAMTTTASVTAGAGFWPVAFPVVASPTSSSVMISNCLRDDCFSKFSVPSPSASATAVSLTRASNVVSVAIYPYSINITPYPVGSSIVISGCTTHTDLNGTFTITANNDNNLAPVLQWSQAGSNEGPDTTCQMSQPQPGLTFYPMAFILSSVGTGLVTTEPNNVAWSTGDVLRAAPSSAYLMTGEDLEMGQPAGAGASLGYLVTDHGPSPMYALYQAINTGGYNSPLPATAPTMFNIEGNFQNIFNIKWLPAHNGCIICITATTNPITGGFTPFYLLQDGTGGGPTILVDPINDDFTFNMPAIAPGFRATGAASAVPSGQISYGGTTVASSNCGSLSGAAGCIVVNISGTTHYVPYW